MKAIVYTEYGSPDVLHLAEVEKPAPGEGEVLIKVHAASATSSDCNMRGFTFVPDGFRFASRLGFGLNRPRKQILGVEFAGEIEAVGPGVTRFKPGDQVFGLDGMRVGAYAEYKVMKAGAGITHKPANLSYEQAVAIPNGALTAYTFLKKIDDIQPGEKVLVNGASGSVGTYAVQLAKHFGAEVTGVCSGRNVELVQTLGADHVIDYTQQDFTQNGQTYDVIFDTVGKAPFAQSKRALRPGGRYLTAAGGLREFRQMLLTGLFGSRKVKAGMSSEKLEDLEFLKGLAEEGVLQPVIDRSYPLAETAEAHRYVDSGRKRGNVVIQVLANGAG